MLSFLEFILESTKMKVQYFYSVRFRQFLTEIVKSKKPGFEVANFILLAEQSNQVEDDITFIDMTDFNDKVSFIQLNRVKRMYDLQKKEIEDEGKTVVVSFEQWIERVAISEEALPWKNQRTDLYIGRFVNRVSERGAKKLDSTEIERFVNTYKAKFDSFKTGESRFEEVSGEVIKHWYLYRNYEEVKGQLGNSCMRTGNCQSFFKIYTENPEVCSLLIFKSKEDYDKIAGRALVWKLSNGRTYMDRVYTVRDSDFQLFEEYAKKRDWLTEENMSYSDFSKMTVELKKWKFEEYPYMDTFKCLNVREGYLTSDEDRWPSPGFWKLESTSGRYDGDNLVWSNYHDEYIDRDEAVQTLRGDWCLEDSAVYLEYKDGWTTQDEETVSCSYNGENYFLEDTYYSDILEDYIYTEDAIEIVTNSDGDTDWIYEGIEDSIIKIELDGEEVKTLPMLTIFNPIDKKYYFKDAMIDNQRLIYHIIKSQELIPWEEVVKQILESNFHIQDIDLPNGENKFDGLTEIKSPQKMEVLRPSSSLNRDELSNVIKCLLIISPDKSERRSSGEPLASKGHKVFNRNLLEKYQNNPVLKDLLSKGFINLLDSGWSWKEYAGKAAVQLSDYFISDVLKDPRAIATWYSIKMPH
jgi:hypothetical protein